MINQHAVNRLCCLGAWSAMVAKGRRHLRRREHFPPSSRVIAQVSSCFATADRRASTLGCMT